MHVAGIESTYTKLQCRPQVRAPAKTPRWDRLRPRPVGTSIKLSLLQLCILDLGGLPSLTEALGKHCLDHLLTSLQISNVTQNSIYEACTCKRGPTNPIWMCMQIWRGSLQLYTKPHTDTLPRGSNTPTEDKLKQHRASGQPHTAAAKARKHRVATVPLQLDHNNAVVFWPESNKC